MRRRLSLWAPVVACMMAFFIVSSQSDPPLPDDLSDKTGHSVAYAGLGALATRAVAGGFGVPVTARTAVWALTLTVGYGVSDEVHQSFTPGRSADIEDVYADAVGALMGLVACGAWGIIAPRVND